MPPGFPIVGVGASAGGLEAFTSLLHYLPLDTGLGFVLVQHLNPEHESALTQILTRATSLPVCEVTNNLRVQANHVYIIPPNRSLRIIRGVLRLQPRQKTAGAQRSIDGFFESLAQDQRERAIGVVLSGTATDGTLGLESIKAEGGITFAQDSSARYDSMPRSAVAAGCVDFVLNPEGIAAELARIARHPFVTGRQSPHALSFGQRDERATASHPDKSPLLRRPRGSPQKSDHPTQSNAISPAEESGFGRVLLLLRNHSGVDFSLYKSTTIHRRIARRVVLMKQNSLDEYSRFLRTNARELDALYSDVLISVTSFFRNLDAFDILKRKVFPRLLQQRGQGPLRVWVLGCSTGQEAYSLAMTFVESAENAPKPRKLQVFATDLNEALLDKARHGLYPKSIVEEVSPNRLRRFFVEEEAGYRVAKPLREMVVFARQNLITDPPFSRMDLISCRNLLIYLDPGLQRKAIPSFHYALKPDGFLFLGASESIAGFTDLFEPADKKHKIYARKMAPIQSLSLPVRRDLDKQPVSARSTPQPLGKEHGKTSEPLRGDLNIHREADRVSVNQFAPPGVLVSDDLQILQFRGPTGAYLQPPSAGRASFDILKMAREGLMLPLRAAINQARKENKTARRENVRVEQNGATLSVNLVVIPLKNLRERCFLVLFEDDDKPLLRSRNRSQSPNDPSPARPAAKRAESRRISALERELSETRDYLQSVQEQQEAANEELQASNEEVQSANEELQSINEELETSKEELESANEELITVNEEMAGRNAELNRLNADLSNLQSSIKLPILLLGRDLAIRRFSAPAERIFNLLATDVGRPLSGIRHGLVVREPVRGASSAPAQTGDSPRLAADTSHYPLEDLVREVIETVREQERELADKAGRWYSLRVRPYFTVDNKVDGAVLLLVDITEHRDQSRELEGARLAAAVLRTARDPLLILDPGLRVQSANDAFYKIFKVSPAETEGRLFFDLGNHQWRIPGLRALLEEILPRNNSFNDFEVTHDFPNIGPRTMVLDARRMESQDGAPQRIVLVIHDITERKRADEQLALAKAELADRAAHLEALVAERTARLQETISELEHFSYTITHDMRAPLRALQGFGGLLLEESGAELSPRSADYVRRIVDAASRMDALIRDSLQYAKVVRERLPLAPIEPAPILRGILESYPTFQVPHAEIQLVEPLPPVVANPAGLAQCFSNLLANAIKFVKPGKVPRIRIWAESTAHRVRFWFKDNGIGIPREYQSRIFGMFQQLDKSYEGTGIGLSLVRKTAERMDGTVGVESEPGEGSRFWLEFKPAPPR